MIIPEAAEPTAKDFRALWTALVIAFGALAIGVWGVVVYERAGLTLSHYDAKAHLVVARRVLDSITPSWQQFGAVWLPLPHLLNALPVQVDAWYRTGASAIALSVLCFAATAYAIARLVLAPTGSVAGAALGVAVFALNPNVLYLQTTPMAESLLFATSTLSVWLVTDWVERGSSGFPSAAAWMITAACMTRYEAWPITASLLVVLGAILVRRGRAPRDAARLVVRIAAYPVGAILLFIVNSKITTDAWFVTGGFFVPDNPARGQIVAALQQVVEGWQATSGYWITLAAIVGAAAILGSGLLSKGRESRWLALALFASAALPVYAYTQGHPVRIRYAIPLATAAAVSVGMVVELMRQRAVRAAIAVMMAVVLAGEVRPFDTAAPMVVEAQLDRSNSAARARVTERLRADWDGDKIMVSMGSLAHYMQELSREGFAIGDFVHEGNGRLWETSLIRPAPYVHWLLVEEQAEGGDIVAARAREDAAFLRGFDRIASGGGVALYRARE